MTAATTLEPELIDSIKQAFPCEIVVHCTCGQHQPPVEVCGNPAAWWVKFDPCPFIEDGDCTGHLVCDSCASKFRGGIFRTVRSEIVRIIEKRKL